MNINETRNTYTTTGMSLNALLCLELKMMKYTTYKSISISQPWSYLLTLQLLMTMIQVNNMGAVSANAVTPEIPTVSDNENEYSDVMMAYDDPIEEKRNWQSLQGSWGKRAQSDIDIGAEDKRNWQSLQGAWGKRSQNDNDIRAEEKRNWQSLQGSWGKRSQNDNDYSGNIKFNEQIFPVLITTYMESKPKTQLALLANPFPLEHFINQQNSVSSVGSIGIDGENIFNSKRGWKQMSAAWGKRRNNDAGSASSSKGFWGKRQTNWPNLKGMWGKRSSNGW